jgi:hypothetical protein
VISAQIGELELMEVWYEDDPTMRVKVNFPFFLGTGTKKEHGSCLLRDRTRPQARDAHRQRGGDTLGP